MPLTTSTTTVHRSELSLPAQLHEEALALAQRVNRKIRTPLPATQQGGGDCEYEPQSWTMPPSPTTVPRTR